MKLVAQLLAALALVAYATPALPCPGHAEKQQTTAANQADGNQAGKQAKSEKADKEKLAKKGKAGEKSKTTTN